MTDLLISVSQMNKFATCEQSWLYDKKRPEARDAVAVGRPLLLGSLMHELIQAWYSGRDWRGVWNTELANDPYWEPGFEEPEHFIAATEIMEDWETYRGKSPDFRVMGTEIPFSLPVPGVPDVTIRGFLDGMLAMTDAREPSDQDLTVVEIKTMGRWGREKLAPVDPQLLLYAWAARHLMPVKRLRFEAISTYKYKDPSPERRFKRLEWEIPWDRVDIAVENMANMARRMVDVRDETSPAILNFSDKSCSWCDHKDVCWGDQPEIITTQGVDVR